jgi:hypothetical protein
MGLRPLQRRCHHLRFSPRLVRSLPAAASWLAPRDILWKHDGRSGNKVLAPARFDQFKTYVLIVKARLTGFHRYGV